MMPQDTDLLLMASCAELYVFVFTEVIQFAMFHLTC